MIYAFIAAILLGFGAGFGLSQQLAQADIVRLESAIQSANDQAAIRLANAKKDAERIKIDQQKLSQQLEKSHEQNIQTINALRDRLAYVRLPTASSSRGRDTKNRNHNPATAEEQAEHQQLSADFDRLVKAEFYRADTVAAYADACYTFVVENNCGAPLPERPVEDIESQEASWVDLIFSDDQEKQE